MDVPYVLCKVLECAATSSMYSTVHRLGTQSRAFWEWAICELRIQLNDDVWALVPEDLMKDREFMIRVANSNPYTFTKLGAFAHDLDFFKTLRPDSWKDWSFIDWDTFEPLFTTFAPCCLETHDGATAMAKYFGLYYFDDELPNDHWCRTDVDIALAWLRLDAGHAFCIFKPHVRSMEVVWKTALQHRTRVYFQCFAQLFPKHVLQTRAYVLQLAEVDGDTLRHAPEFADDEEIARRVMKTSTYAFRTLSHRLRNDRAFLLSLLHETSYDELRTFQRVLPPTDDLEVRALLARAPMHRRDQMDVDRREWVRGVVDDCLRAVEDEEVDARVELYTDVLVTHMKHFPTLKQRITHAVERVYHPEGRVHTCGDKRAYTAAFGLE